MPPWGGYIEHKYSKEMYALTLGVLTTNMGHNHWAQQMEEALSKGLEAGICAYCNL